MGIWVSEAQRIGSVAIYMHGDNLDPRRVTELLGIKPDASWTSGEERRLSSGASVSAKTGMWTLSVPLADDDIDDILKKLTGALGENFSRISSVPGIESAYADIFVCISREQSDAGYTLKLPNSELSTIANAGLDLQVTVSVVDCDV
ncbi:DUF4279 domain-containing protein [Rhizobium sp. A22-96]